MVMTPSSALSMMARVPASLSCICSANAVRCSTLCTCRASSAFNSSTRLHMLLALLAASPKQPGQRERQRPQEEEGGDGGTIAEEGQRQRGQAFQARQRKRQAAELHDSSLGRLPGERTVYAGGYRANGRRKPERYERRLAREPDAG